ncbi:MAG: hypothetical protein ACM3ML_10305 [Micromonosporaceae bacterium]
MRTGLKKAEAGWGADRGMTGHMPAADEIRVPESRNHLHVPWQPAS